MSKTIEPSRVIGPEDVKTDQFVTITHVMYELLPDECTSIPQRVIDPLRVTLMCPCAGRPMKVVEVCLPFVLVKDPAGTHLTIDLRRYQIALLSNTFGRKAFRKISGKEDADK
ncbi:MAG: hypothetical protein WD768_22555 [Phycisphaeraceae bacterium]